MKPKVIEEIYVDAARHDPRMQRIAAGRRKPPACA